MDSCGSIGGVNSHKGDTDDYKHEVTYNNTLHKVSSEMLLGLIYGLVNPHTLIVIIISCTSFFNLFMFRYDTQTHTRNGAQRSARLSYFQTSLASCLQARQARARLHPTPQTLPATLLRYSLTCLATKPHTTYVHT